MIKIRYETEDWRDKLGSVIDFVEGRLGASLNVNCYDEVADELCNRVLARLIDEGYEVKPAYQQSVGNYVLLQHASTEAERDAFDSALQAELGVIEPYVEKVVSNYKDMA